MRCFESGTLMPNCNYRPTVVYIAPDYCCSDHKWHIESYTVRSSITVILIVWYCIGFFGLRAWADGDENADAMHLRRGDCYVVVQPRGLPLCHRYRLISRTGSHTGFRGTYLKRLWSFIEEMDSAGRCQGPRGLSRTGINGTRFA